MFLGELKQTGPELNIPFQGDPNIGKQIPFAQSGSAVSPRRVSGVWGPARQGTPANIPGVQKPVEEMTIPGSWTKVPGAGVPWVSPAILSAGPMLPGEPVPALPVTVIPSPTLPKTMPIVQPTAETPVTVTPVIVAPVNPFYPTYVPPVITPVYTVATTAIQTEPTVIPTGEFITTPEEAVAAAIVQAETEQAAAETAAEAGMFGLSTNTMLLIGAAGLATLFLFGQQKHKKHKRTRR